MNETRTFRTTCSAGHVLIHGHRERAGVAIAVTKGETPTTVIVGSGAPARCEIEAVCGVHLAIEREGVFVSQAEDAFDRGLELARGCYGVHRSRDAADATLWLRPVRAGGPPTTALRARNAGADWTLYAAGAYCGERSPRPGWSRPPRALASITALGEAAELAFHTPEHGEWTVCPGTGQIWIDIVREPHHTLTTRTSAAPGPHRPAARAPRTSMPLAWAEHTREDDAMPETVSYSGPGWYVEHTGGASGTTHTVVRLERLRPMPQRRLVAGPTSCARAAAQIAARAAREEHQRLRQRNAPEEPHEHAASASRIAEAQHTAAHARGG